MNTKKFFHTNIASRQEKPSQSYGFVDIGGFEIENLQNVFAERVVSKFIAINPRRHVASRLIERNILVSSSASELERFFSSCNMIFLTAGMGAFEKEDDLSLLLKELGRQKGLLKIAILTYPALFEGLLRKEIVEKRIHDLSEVVDVMIIIPVGEYIILTQEMTKGQRMVIDGPGSCPGLWVSSKIQEIIDNLLHLQKANALLEKVRYSAWLSNFEKRDGVLPIYVYRVGERYKPNGSRK